MHLWRLSSVGIELAVAIVLGTLLGNWGDRHFGTAPWLLIAGFVVGAAAGFKGLIREARRAQRHLTAQAQAEAAAATATQAEAKP